MNSVQITRDVMRAISRRATAAVKFAAADAMAYLDANPKANVQNVVELFSALRLIESCDLPIEGVKAALLAEFPDEGEKIANMSRAGVNCEMDYIWARPADPKRSANGLIMPDEMMRINGMNKFLQPKPVKPTKPTSVPKVR